jgi:hypothetical protein
MRNLWLERGNPDKDMHRFILCQNHYQQGLRVISGD